MQADRDVLEARFAKLQELQSPQKRDLTSLRWDSARILPQSGKLSQASKPEIEEKLLKKLREKQEEALKEPNPTNSDTDAPGTTLEEQTDENM